MGERSIKSALSSWISSKFPNAVLAMTMMVLLVHYNRKSTTPFTEMQEDTATIRPAKIWISISVCWSSNTRMHRKGHFPYRLATKLAVLLWRARTRYEVLVQVVHDPKDAAKPELLEFEQDLRNASARVILSPTQAPLLCSLQSQLQRMLAYLDEDAILGHDIVVTSDADAFPMARNIFDATLTNSSFNVWVYQYDDSLNHNNTFPMSFVAMTADKWRQALNGAASPADLVSKFETSANLVKWSVWFYDQVILSRALLEKNLCPLPADHELWTKFNLIPEVRSSQADLEDGCYRGQGWGNCNKAVPVMKNGSPCTWWHFHPEDDKRTIWKKYFEILD